MAFLYAKSSTWRWIITRSKESRAFFATFGVTCVLLPWGVAKLTQSATNPMTEEELERRKKELRGGRVDGQVMARVNKERLGQLLSEVQQHENTEDRYRAALRGETLTGAPGARVRGGGGTTIQKMPEGSVGPQPTAAPAAPKNGIQSQSPQSQQSQQSQQSPQSPQSRSAHPGQQGPSQAPGQAASQAVAAAGESRTGRQVAAGKASPAA